MSREPNSAAKLTALEIAPTLPGIWAGYPDGFTANDLADTLQIPYHLALAVVDELIAMGKADEGRQGKAKTACRPGTSTASGAGDLTGKQAAILDKLVSMMGKDGTVHASSGDVAGAAMTSMTGATPMMRALERKGYIEVITRGTGRRKTHYRVHPDGKRVPAIVAAPLVTESCGSCRFMGKGECRRFPPTHEGHPAVGREDWCGEWQRSNLGG